MIKIVFLIILVLTILAPSLFAEEIAAAESSEAKLLKTEYHDVFDAMPINSNIVFQDFLDGLATYEEAKMRLETIKVTILYRSCKFKDNE